MLRNVLLKAVENLRRSQNREQGKEVGEKQQEEELQLPKTNQRVDEMEANCDKAEERIERRASEENATAQDENNQKSKLGSPSISSSILQQLVKSKSKYPRKYTF